MKKVLIIFLLFILILPASAYNSGEDNFNDWTDKYYESNKVSRDDLKELFDDLGDGNINRDDFSKLKYVYNSVYSVNDSKVKKIMDKDFKNGDENQDGDCHLMNLAKCL